jgi:hypothetical protein
MDRRLKDGEAVECLYCETELKPFRGLFDEDFCCREHRDKYFSSFRRALNRLPALETPPPAPMAESVSLAIHATEEPPFSADSPIIPAGTVDLPHKEALAAAEVLVEEQVTPLVEFPAETVDLPLLLATYKAGEPAPAVSSAADSEETPFGPPAADFLPVAVVAVAGAQTLCSTSLNALPVSYAIEFPAGQTAWAALIEMEQRPVELLEPPQTVAATPFVPMPAPLELSAHNPAIAQTPAMLPEAALQAAESAPHAQSVGACGFTSPWNYADPLTPAPLALTLASFCPEPDGAAWLPTAEFAEVTLACLPLASSPITAPEIQLAHEFYAPVFTPSRETIPGAQEGLDEYDQALDQMPAADSPAPPEIAPALLINSAPLDRPALLPTCAAQMMPPALALSSTRSSSPVPLSPASTIEGQPHLAPELMADIPQSPAANQAAEPHAHAPLRHLFGSSVRIKNWRLRITFAKPA